MDKLLNLNNFSVLNSQNTDNNVIKSLKLLFIFGHIHNESEVIFAINDDRVYAFGKNRYGLLGLGHNRSVKYCELNDTLSGKQLVDIAFGIRHCIALTASGQCYGWGNNEFGELGIGSLENKTTPQLIEGLNGLKVVQICCGNNFSMALTINGEVFAWGRNGFAQLANGNKDKYLVPTHASKLSNEVITSISCGRSCSTAITTEGRVYIFGAYFVDMSTGSNWSVKRTTSIKKDMSEIVIRKAVCGPNHLLFLTTDGYVYGVGNNNCGQVGNGSTEAQPVPVKVCHHIRFKDVVAFPEADLSVGISLEGKYYIWGLHYVNNRSILTPEEVSDSSIHSVYDIHALYCNKPITYHAILIDPMSDNDCQSSSRSTKSVVRRKVFSKNDISIRLEFESQESIDDDIQVVKTVLNGDSCDSRSLVPVSELNSRFGSNSDSLSSNLLQKFLNKAFNNPEDCDLKLIFSDKFIYCHKTILRIRNKKFWQKCENQFKNGITDEIRIKAYSYNAFLAFVKHLYGQTPEVNDENCADLLKIAVIFEEPELKDICTEYMDSRIDLSNVCQHYEKAVKNSSTDLEKSCIEFVSKNFKQVFNSKEFLSLDDSLSRQLVLSISKFID